MVDIVAAYLSCVCGSQLRYAATISTIKACNFIDFIIILFYNNLKKNFERNLIRNFLSSLKMTLKGSKHVATSVVI